MEDFEISLNSYDVYKNSILFKILIELMSKSIIDIFKEHDHSKLDKDIIKYIEKEHKILVEKFGARILKIKRISRENSDTPYPSQNADFIANTIKKLITQVQLSSMTCLL